MVLAGKIFEIREKISLKDLKAKLENFRLEETYQEDDFQFILTTEIQGLTLKPDRLEGEILKDEIIRIRQKNELKPVPKTIEAPFLFYNYGDKTLLVVVEKKWKANNLANLLSEVIFDAVGFILEVRIPPENLKKYHEDNPESTKVIFFSDVDIPNVKKLSLYGANLANTSLYTDFLSHGGIWYVVVTSKKYGYVAGLTGNGIVTIFNRVSVQEFLTYVVDEVFPLLGR
ncbi:hypothetical protein DRO26_02005 [Candidatus Bathyarchaeota archaeon]|nr:MAG: hypothetical protein DRO26_02005 [Candidatus Bathyarchaeota archaeon]